MRHQGDTSKPMWALSGEEKRPSSRSIPSLDGLRAVSVGMVILSHYMGWAMLSTHGSLHALLSVISQGSVGVSAFFIISGFLITTLLLNELDDRGSINIKRFYFRRALRIFPPYYFYLAIVLGVAYATHRAIPKAAWITAATYVSNYYPYSLTHPESTGWLVGHTWSLSVEEQFYLLWPFALVALSRRAAFRLGVGLLFLVPLLRWLTTILIPSYQLDEQWYRLFHTTLDTLMTGCVMAFLVRRSNFRTFVERWFHPAILTIALLCVCLSTFILRHAPIWFEALLGVSITTMSLALLILYVVVHSESTPGRVLNWAPLRHIGKISYSLYLWQQAFLGPDHVPSRIYFVLLALLCAEVSFWCVERPSLVLRGKLERMLQFSSVSPH